MAMYEPPTADINYSNAFGFRAAIRCNMPPETHIQDAHMTSVRPPIADANDYHRLGHTTLFFFFFKFGLPAIALFLLEIMILGALSGGKNLPPFSEMLSANSTAMTVVQIAAGIVPLLIMLAAACAVAMAYISYWAFSYKIEYNYLSIVKGIVNRKKISIPFRQIQNVDIEQTLVNRFFGLVSLVIMTSGNDDPQHTKDKATEIVMPPLNAVEGLHLQQHLLDRSNVQRIVTQDPSDESVVSPPLD